jgi:hypothetical protein
MLLLLEERGVGKNPGVGGVVLSHIVGGGDHGIEFLPKLDGLSSLVSVVGGHHRWCCSAQGGDTVTEDATEGERAASP